jgi:morphogenetic protein associated with SpoVID
MTNYRRLISYIYAYEGEVKGKNIGFAKLESRNGQCKLSVNVKKVYVGSSDLGVYLLAPGKEILLGNIFIRGGSGEFRAVVSVENAADSGYSMDHCYGLTIHEADDSWRAYTTIWEDAVAHAAEVELADVTSGRLGDSEQQIHKKVEELAREIGDKKIPLLESSRSMEPAGVRNTDVPETGTAAASGTGNDQMELAGAGAADMELAGAGAADMELAGAGAADMELAGAGAADMELAGAEAADMELAGAGAADMELAGAGAADMELAGAEAADGGQPAPESVGVELTGAGPSGTESLEGELSGEGPFGAEPAGSGCLEGELSGTQSSGAGPEEAGSAGKEMSDAKSADAVTAGRESADVKLAGAELADEAMAGRDSTDNPQPGWPGENTVQDHEIPVWGESAMETEAGAGCAENADNQWYQYNDTQPENNMGQYNAAKPEMGMHPASDRAQMPGGQTGAWPRAGEQMGMEFWQESGTLRQREMLRRAGRYPRANITVRQNGQGAAQEPARTPAPSDRNTPGQAAMLPDRNTPGQAAMLPDRNTPGQAAMLPDRNTPGQAVMPPDRNTLGETVMPPDRNTLGETVMPPDRNTPNQTAMPSDTDTQGQTAENTDAWIGNPASADTGVPVRSSIPTCPNMQNRRGMQPRQNMRFNRGMPQRGMAQPEEEAALRQDRRPDSNVMAGRPESWNTPAVNAPVVNPPVMNTTEGNARQGNAPQNNARQGNAPQNNARQGNAPQNNAPQENAPQNNAPQGNAPQGNTPQNNAPQGNAQQGNVPQNNTPQDNVPEANVPAGNVREEDILLGNPQDLQRLEEEEQEDIGPHKLWEGFRKRYAKIQAFDSANGCEILTIKPQDIGLLPRENWNYGNNSFLLHGYYNYRYLILARIGSEEQGRVRYILGVPGHYYSNEKYMASMFGFPHFVLSKKQPSQDGRFGYWYADVRMDNQD